MKNLFLFFIEFKRTLSFAALCSFLSGFGQTYFVSLFVPSVSDQVGIHPGEFGSVYAIATLCSGFLLARVGRATDFYGEARMFYPAGIILALGLLLLSGAENVWWLALALFALRIGGQGTLGLLSSSSMARYFARRRGLALAFASLGFPLSEFVLPGLVVLSFEFFSWQQTLFLMTGILFAGVFIVGGQLLRKPLQGESAAKKAPKAAGSHWRFGWWRDPVFILILLSSGIPGAFAGTILFLYQLPIGEAKGWSAAWMAVCFSGFALSRGFFGLLSGPLTDKFSGGRLYALSILPVPFALIIIRYTQIGAGAMACYILFGVSFGFAAARTAFLAERYGVEIIGQVKGIFNASKVLLSAAGPLLGGYMLQNGFTYLQLLEFLIWSCSFFAATAFAVLPFDRRFKPYLKP